METMQQSIQWARGGLLSEAASDVLLLQVAEYLQEIRTARQHVQQERSGYEAPLTWTGAPGPPRYLISHEQLSFLLSCGFRMAHIAGILNVSLATVKRCIRQFGLSCYASYADITDANLDTVVCDLVGNNEQLGPESVRAHLRGIHVQRTRVRGSMLRINPRAAALRTMSRRLHRRLYQVAGPNSVWHIDGSHKLIRSVSSTAA